jgi:hypothetical protein
VRRTRSRIGERQTEVVTYEIAPSGMLIRHWSPTTCFAIGQLVETPVRVRVYQGRNGPAYALEVPSGAGEEF